MNNFSNDKEVRKLQYQSLLVKEGAFTEEEVVELTMVQLRNAVDYLFPMTITETRVTASGGVSTITRKAA